MFRSIISVALFAASALGAIQFTNAPNSIEAGKTYTFTWTSTGSGPVTILLKNGESTNLQTVGTITPAGTGGSYTWTAPSTYAPGSYAFEIDQGSDANYWGPVSYTGGSGASAPASGPASAAPSGSTTPAPSGVTSKAPMQSGSTIASGHSNKTTTSTSMSTSKTLSTSTTTASATGKVVTSSNSAASLGSPVALVLGALAAMLYLQ